MDDETKRVLTAQLQSQEQIIIDSETVADLAHEKQIAAAQAGAAALAHRDEARQTARALRRLLGIYKWQDDPAPNS